MSALLSPLFPLLPEFKMGGVLYRTSFGSMRILQDVFSKTIASRTGESRMLTLLLPFAPSLPSPPSFHSSHLLPPSSVNFTDYIHPFPHLPSIHPPLLRTSIVRSSLSNRPSFEPASSLAFLRNLLLRTSLSSFVQTTSTPLLFFLPFILIRSLPFSFLFNCTSGRC